MGPTRPSSATSTSGRGWTASRSPRWRAPAQSSLAALEQYRKKYVFLAPDDYDVSYVDIVLPDGASLTLDAQPFGVSPQALASGFGIARVKLGPGTNGTHVLESSEPVGIQVMGYGLQTSYQYPGGSNLMLIAPPPPAILHLRAVEVSEQTPAVPELGPEAGFPAEVSVTQRQQEVLVRLADEEGAVAERRARPGTSAIQEAIVACVGELVDPSAPQARLLLVDIREGSGSEVVTVVLELGAGEHSAGAAVVATGREYAVALAAWRRRESWRRESWRRESWRRESWRR